LKIGLKVCAVKAPSFGDNRKAQLKDIAVSVGATVISEELGLKLEDNEISVLGTSKNAIISKDDSIIMEGAGSK